MATVRLTHRRTGSVVVVPEEKAASLAILGYEGSTEKPAKKAPAKKAASSKSASK